MNAFAWLSLGFLMGVVYCSFFEWLLHRYVMHRRWGRMDYSFQRHTLVHHHVFKADESYHLMHEGDKETVPMAWWNGPLLIVISQVPFGVAAFVSGQWFLLGGSTLATVLYYGAYEYLHWCMHIPKKRRLERSGVFFRLNGHHLLHHRYMKQNFNVVFPLADFCLGTLMVRSRIRFAQARGPEVPDVQPSEEVVGSRRVDFR